MTRLYAARKLLEHGPLTAVQFREITGWPKRDTNTTLQALHRSKAVTRQGDYRGYVYGLAA
jgi:hypothetical protein